MTASAKEVLSQAQVSVTSLPMSMSRDGVDSNVPSYKLRTRKIEEYEMFEDKPEFKAELSNLDFKYDHLQPNRLADLEKSGSNVLW